MKPTTYNIIVLTLVSGTVGAVLGLLTSPHHHDSKTTSAPSVSTQNAYQSCKKQADTKYTKTSPAWVDAVNACAVDNPDQATNYLNYLYGCRTAAQQVYGIGTTEDDIKVQKTLDDCLAAYQG